MGKEIAGSVSTGPANAGGVGWADLPECLLLSVLDRLLSDASIADLYAVTAVCRSWRDVAAPPASALIRGGGRPPLLLSPVLAPLEPNSTSRDGDWLHPARCRLLSPADPAASYRSMLPPDVLAGPVIGCSHGHLISCRGSRPFLANVTRGDVLLAPELPPDCEPQHGILTGPLSSAAHDCDLLLLSSDSDLLRWRVGEEEWSQYPLREHTNKCMNRITVFRGQIFALDLRGGLFAVELSPSFSARDLAVRWPARSSSPRYLFPFPRPLFECGGELLFVHIDARFDAEGLFRLDDKVEVFRLDLGERPSWVRVESLGDTALFVDIEHGSALSCPNPSSWGGRSNCIYLAERGSDTWTVLDMRRLYFPILLQRASISSRRWPSPVWVFPSMLH